MTDRRYIVGVDNIEKLNFDDFYINYLNKLEEGYHDLFEKRYRDDNISHEQFVEIIKEKWIEAITDCCYISDDFFINRDFAFKLAEYIATVGIPISIRSINGWSTQVIIVTGDNPQFKKYSRSPNKDLQGRFDYMTDWAKRDWIDF